MKFKIKDKFYVFEPYNNITKGFEVRVKIVESIVFYAENKYFYKVFDDRNRYYEKDMFTYDEIKELVLKELEKL